MRRNLNREIVGAARLHEEYSCGKHKFHISADGEIRKGSNKPHIKICKRRDKKRTRRIIDRVYKDLLEVV